MTLEEFAALVAEMRHAQKEYFRTRSLSAQNSAKHLESRVDKKLKEIHLSEQGRLFE